MKTGMKRRVAQEARGVAWTLPALAFLILFTLYPMANAFVTSFYNWNLTGRKKYIGTYNYQKLLAAPRCTKLIWRTVQVCADCSAFYVGAGLLYWR